MKDTKHQNPSRRTMVLAIDGDREGAIASLEQMARARDPGLQVLVTHILYEYPDEPRVQKVARLVYGSRPIPPGPDPISAVWNVRVNRSAH